MKSVFWLVQGSIAGRPGPEWEPWSVEELRAGGFRAVINLSEFPCDFRALEGAGIDARWVPLPTDVPPTEKAKARCVEELPKAYEFLASQIARGRKVLIHCHAGRDRTGMLMALHMSLVHKVPAEEAIRRVREVRPTAITAPGWEEMALEVIPEVAATLAPE